MDPIASPGRVLVVDGDLSARGELEAALKVWFGVHCVKTAADAEAALRQAEFDVVVTDTELPGPSGLALLKTINTLFPTVKVIFLTRQFEAAEVLQAERTEKVVRVLAKPLDPKRVISWVASSVKLARMSRTTAKLKRYSQKLPIVVD